MAGRWFRAKSLDGPWTFATADLPADFAKIPASSPAARGASGQFQERTKPKTRCS